jgi:integrase/recombinase XerC/integrase/recombinase XerD
METHTKIARGIQEIGIDDYLPIWIENFLHARMAENLSPGTIHFYQCALALFTTYADTQAINKMGQITPTVIRDFLTSLKDRHNEGGVHAAYRSLKVFLNWYWAECEVETRNPFSRVQPPRVPEKIMPPISLEDAGKLLDAINPRTLAGLRDRAVLLTLLDCGLRASELVGLNIEDFDNSGELHIIRGKGGKGRIVFLSEKTRRAIRAYLRKRQDRSPALFANHFGERLKYNGLRGILFRLGRRAGLKEIPTPHMFRRAFALETLRAGGDLYTLQRQMGHADLSVLKKYLRLPNEDMRAAHARTSPVDRLK